MRDYDLNQHGQGDIAPVPSHALTPLPERGSRHNGAQNGISHTVAKIQPTRNGNGAATNGKAKVSDVTPLYPAPSLSIVPTRGPKPPSRLRTTSIHAREVHASLAKHMLVDGFDMVIDLKQSRGARLYCARHDRWFLDFFSFFVSLPIGMNHPHLTTPEFLEKLAWVAIQKPSNSDVYTVEMAEFLETFSRVAIPEYLPHAFFIEGGAAAVENCLKAAFDWKVRKNFAKGHKRELGHRIIHFRQAFHGRSGYTLSLTNTDPAKTSYFPKFDWPRVSNPAMRFPLTEENLRAVEQAEQQSIAEIQAVLREYPDDIAALIIEPIQGEGGDNHFRPEFMQALRTLADENEFLLIFDEVQTGVGLTGKMWAHQHFVEPDLMSFGKKSQVCGVLAGRRMDEVPDNVFRTSSRINSTWGGSLVDMVRFQRYLEIIEAEDLVGNARVQGAYLLANLRALEAEFPTLVSNTRGRGLFCALDLPDVQQRDELLQNCFKNGLLILPSGTSSIRFRPGLDIRRHEVDEAIQTIRQGLVTMAGQTIY